MDIDDPIKTTVEELRKLLNIENIIGDKIETDDKTIIPLMKMGMGFGAGIGESKKSENGGTGSGGAAKVEPIAMLVIFKGVEGPEGVKLFSLSSHDAVS